MIDSAFGQTFGLYQKYATDFTPGDHVLPHSRLNEFCEEVEKFDLLMGNFEWGTWYQSSYLVDKPAYIVDATLKECQLLLTAMLRLERFSPGVLENMRRQGVLLAILERLQCLFLKHAF